MRSLLRHRSRLFRAVLALALMAWMTLAAGAFAAPLPAPPMQHGLPGSATRTVVAMTMAMSNLGAHCAGTSRSASQRFASAKLTHVPATSGHDGSCPCCNGTGCTCASMCGGMTAIAYATPVFDAAQAALPRPDTHAPAAAHFAPPLRPPIV